MISSTSTPDTQFSCHRQSLNPITNNVPVREPVIPALGVDVLQAAVVGGHACHQFKARGQIVEQFQVGLFFVLRLLGGVNAVVDILEPLGFVDLGLADVLVAAVRDLKPGHPVHGAHGGDEVQEGVAFRLHPGLVGDGQVEVHHDACQELVVSAFLDACQLDGPLDMGVGVVTRETGLLNTLHSRLKFLLRRGCLSHGVSATVDGTVKAEKFYVLN